MVSSPSADIVVVGSANLDLVAQVEHLPAAGETVLATGYSEHVGGKGANQATAVGRLGRSVSFVGLVGDDSYGERVREALTEAGVDTSHLGTDQLPTGRALIALDATAENNIIVVSGANGAVTPAVLASSRDLIASAKVVVAQLEVPLAAVIAAATSTQGTFVLNPAPAVTLPQELAELVDVLVVNETEFATLAGTDLPDAEDDMRAVLAEGALGERAVITLGSRGAMVWDAAQLDHVAATSVEVADTTGAGDTFVGALAAALADGQSLLDAARWASVAGALATTAVGATTAMPTAEQVNALMR